MKKILHSFRRSGATVILIFLLFGTIIPSHVFGVEYTEELWEVTDEGLFSPEGNYVREIPADDPGPQENQVTGLPSDDPLADYRQTLINNLGGQKEVAERRIRGIRESLDAEVQEFKTLSETITETEEKLNPIREEIKTLTDQIEVFNEQLRLTRDKISAVEKQIAEKQVALKNLMADIQEREIRLAVQEKTVLHYVSLLYDEEGDFMDLYGDGASTLKLLLADRSVSENLLGQDYMAVMEETGRKVFHDLQEDYRELQERKSALLLGQTKLNRLYRSLAEEKRILEETRRSKKDLLEKTKGEEERYQVLLEESARQQLDSALAIQNLRDNLELIETKLDLLEDTIESEKAGLPLIPEAEKILEESALLQEKSFFQWPVPPNKLTAKFHDASYPKKWGIHQAIDIRAPQFTPIEAPANGYVVEAKDNGMGYSYIILAHKNNLVTVYGHVYEIKVKPGALVKQGEILGLTGGTPGTHGAGLQTTGPHLHFEVHYKGSPVNPLGYLPVYEMPIEYIPEEYLK